MFGINQRKLRLCLVQWQLADFTVYTVILKFKCFQWLIDLNLGMWSVITSVFLVIIEVNLINICYLSGKIRLAVTDTEIWKLPHQLKDQDQHLDIINRLFLNLSQILGMFILMSLPIIYLMWGASRLEQTLFPHKHWPNPKVSENSNCHSFFRSYCNFSAICWFNKWGLVSEIVKGVH